MLLTELYSRNFIHSLRLFSSFSGLAYSFAIIFNGFDAVEIICLDS